MLVTTLVFFIGNYTHRMEYALDRDLESLTKEMSKMSKFKLGIEWATGYKDTGINATTINGARKQAYNLVNPHNAIRIIRDGVLCGIMRYNSKLKAPTYSTAVNTNIFYMVNKNGTLGKGYKIGYDGSYLNMGYMRS